MKRILTDDPVKREFQKITEDLIVRRVRLCCLLTLFLIPLFKLLDIVMVPNDLRLFLYFRIASCSVIAILYMLSRLDMVKRHSKILGVVFLEVVGITMLVMTRFSGGYESTYYGGINLIFLGMGLLIPWRLRDAFFTGLLIYATYLVPIFIYDQITNWAIFVNNNLFLTSTLLISLVATYFGHRYRWNEFIAKKEMEQSNQALAKAKGELEESYAKLKELDRAKSEFFANISHELRTPLTLILAPMETVLKKRTSDKGQQTSDIRLQTTNDGRDRRQLEIAYQNALRLLKLINNLLDLAKLDAGKMELFLAKADLETFVKGIVASVEPMAEKKGLTLTCDLPDKLPKTYLDRDKIEKVILNLVFNSIKFTEAGGKVVVSARRVGSRELGVRSKDKYSELRLPAGFVEGTPDSELFQFCISDTGIGIAPEFQKKLFQRFSQADASSTRRHEGTGIGLALAKELVELHQGRIWVQSEVRKGTSVFFTIPVMPQIPKEILRGVYPERSERAQDDKKEGLQDALGVKAQDDKRVEIIEVDEKKREADWTRELHERSLYQGEGRDAKWFEDPLIGARLKERTLLLVEDNVDMLNFLSFQLQDEYHLVRAANGVEGVEAAKFYKPDLIISDVMMPLKDGYELCREVKENPKTRHIPVILLTAKTDISQKIEGFEHGADEYLTKPFSAEELRARIRSLLKYQETEMQLVQAAKMASIGQLAAGVAHQINNPIFSVSAEIENLMKRYEKVQEGAMSQEEYMTQLLHHSIPLIQRGLERSYNIVLALKNFSRVDRTGVHYSVNLNHELDQVLMLLASKMGKRISIEKRYGELQGIECKADEMNQVLMNIVDNAIEAIEGEGKIILETHPLAGAVEIRIKDTGRGINPADVNRIFEPFFSTKGPKSTGLGLAISDAIVRRHGGDIRVTSRVGQGSEFIVTIPDQKALKKDEKMASERSAA